jgi:Flp pilus assembly protein TadB
MRALLRDPLGVQLLVAAALLQVVGMLVIHRMVKVEY